MTTQRYHFHILLFILFSITINNSVYSYSPLRRGLMELSPADKITNRYRFDLQSHISDLIAKQPALYQMQNSEGIFYPTSNNPKNNTDSLINRLYRRTLATLRHSDTRLSGDYLPYEGNAFADTEVNAEAIHGTSQHGTIYGSVSFAIGSHLGYGWNAIRHAELYIPYLIADSTGGDYRYENYMVTGGYSGQLNKLYYGLGGSIRGEIAYRQTDPRCANTSSWLTLDASIAIPFDSTSLLAFRASYIRTKQYLHLWNWRPNQQDRFFITYGFGYYDLQESPVSFGIRRMYYIQGLQTQLTYSNSSKKSYYLPEITADIEYTFMSMKTEEASAKNLFGSNSHHINGSLWLNLGKQSHLGLLIGIQTQNRIRTGKENIYETYRPDENYPSIYDFRLVDTRRRYSSIVSESMLQGKIRYRPTAQLSIQALLGVAVDYRTERYASPIYQWSVLAIAPSFGVGVNNRFKKIELGINSRFLIRTPIDYSYNVDGGEFRLDYQHTFLPYAFFTDRSFMIQSEMHISYPFNRQGQRVGIAIRHHVRKGNRPSNVKYEGIPSVVSHLLSHPTDDMTFNSEDGFSVALFVDL